MRVQKRPYLQRSWDGCEPGSHSHRCLRFFSYFSKFSLLAIVSGQNFTFDYLTLKIKSIINLSLRFKALPPV